MTHSHMHNLSIVHVHTHTHTHTYSLIHPGDGAAAAFQYPTRLEHRKQPIRTSRRSLLGLHSLLEPALSTTPGSGGLLLDLGLV